MAVTFLNFINNSLKRVRVIQGDAGNLVTSTVTSTATGLTATEAFTDSSRQTQIDLMLQVANETFHEAFDLGLLGREAATATIALVVNQREYVLPGDFERFAGRSWETRVMRGATTRLLIYEYPEGYSKMLADQLVASDWVGDPAYYAISPVTSSTATGVLIRMDRDPSRASTYNFLYDKRIGFTSTMATEALPFSDTVADSLVPVVAEMWDRAYKKEYDGKILGMSLTRALSYARQNQPKDRWGPRRG